MVAAEPVASAAPAEAVSSPPAKRRKIESKDNNATSSLSAKDKGKGKAVTSNGSNLKREISQTDGFDSILAKLDSESEGQH